MAYWSRLAQSQLTHQWRRRCFHTSSIPYTANNSSSSFAWGDRLSGTTVKPHEFPYNGGFFFARSYSQGLARKEENNSGEPRLNGHITGHIVRLVLTDSEHKIVSLREALEQAKRMNLDLVEVQRSADPPVCKIMDYHKEKYVRQQAFKERVKSKSDVTLRKGPCKEVRITKKIELKDLKMKADSVKRLMERGYRVKCVALPSSRKQDAEHEDLGAVLSTLMELLEDVALVESGPLLERKQAYAILRHVKFGPSKKGGVKKVKDANARPTKGPEEGPAETDTEAEDGVFSDEDAPKYYSEPTGQRHSSEAPVKISPSITPEPLLASENRYKRPGPANNNFRPPFRPEQQFPSDRNQQRRSDFNIPPPPTGVRRQDPSTPSTKASGFGIFSSVKPGGASEDNTSSSSNNVVNRYGGGRRF